MPLAPYACHPSKSRGRRFAESDAPTRTAFQRDRDRIVHSSAFRRLVYKTQVFLNHEGDLFRTRLTHSLEVAQLGRSIARSLQLDEDLVEAIALAHDLGHTPFGHAGQSALNECMQSHGGFEHNLQSLRVVDQLEQRYPAFDGLNLSFETREGILKHCSRANAQRIESLEHRYADGQGGVGYRFIHGLRPSLEAQLCNLADEIAYNAHDVDDGVRSGLISLDQMRDVPLIDKHVREALQDHPHLGEESQQRRLLYEAIRRILSAQVYDVISTTTSEVAKHQPQSAAQVRQCPVMLSFSSSMQMQSQELKSALLDRLYRHDRVLETMAAAQQVVHDLFAYYVQNPQDMGLAVEQHLYRAVADYIAGMTDRFAIGVHERVTGRRLFAASRS